MAVSRFVSNDVINNSDSPRLSVVPRYESRTKGAVLFLELGYAEILSENVIPPSKRRRNSGALYLAKIIVLRDFSHAQIASPRAFDEFVLRLVNGAPPTPAYGTMFPLDKT